MTTQDIDVDALPAARRADRPLGLRMQNWWRVSLRVFATMGRENFTLIAAGCAFYALLALAPSLAAVAALYGFFADPGAITAHLQALEEIAPPQAYALIAEQARALDGAGRSALGWASMGAVLFAVWTARAGVRALIAGISLAYRQREGRGFLMDLVATYLLTFLCITLAAVMLGVVVLAPAALALLPVPGLAETITAVVRWPIALVAVLVGLSCLYRYGPSRRLAQTAWVTPGALTAVALWLIGSLAFSYYVTRFGAYSDTAGALGAVAALLMWFWLSALSALIGAVLNAELELETAADTTVGPDRPIGERGAFVADRIADP